VSGEAYAVIVTHSTSHAIRAEKVLAGAGIVCKLVPVPRHISSDCGVCVRIARVDTDAAIRALADARVDFEGVHDI